MYADADDAYVNFLSGLAIPPQVLEALMNEEGNEFDPQEMLAQMLEEGVINYLPSPQIPTPLAGEEMMASEGGESLDEEEEQDDQWLEEMEIEEWEVDEENEEWEVYELVVMELHNEEQEDGNEWNQDNQEN